MWLLLQSEEEWHKVGAQKQEEAAEAHRSREEQMRRNMREMRRAQLELKDGIQHVQRRKDAQIYDKKRAWELDVQVRAPRCGILVPAGHSPRSQLRRISRPRSGLQVDPPAEQPGDECIPGHCSHTRH